jgi:hypothetical protein
MISRNSNFTEAITEDKVTLTTVCPWCGKERKLVLEGTKAAEYKQGRVAYEAGYVIQAAFPSFTPSEREFILTGICDECWDSM